MGRLFLPLDVMFCDDEKIVAVGERPAWLYLAMCLRAKQLATGDYLTEQQVAKLAVPGWRARMRPLLAAQLVKLAGDRYYIPAWANWNDTAEQVAERRRKDRERKASARNPNGVRADTISDSLLVEGSREENYPPTPATAGEPCPRHKPDYGPNCRGCGTNARAVQKAAKLAALPTWCGRCDESTRLVELPDGRLRRCPDCHRTLRVVS